MPFYLSRLAVILVIISVVLTMIAGLIPSKMAAKKDPVIALRTGNDCPRIYHRFWITLVNHHRSREYATPNGGNPVQLIICLQKGAAPYRPQ